MGYSPWGCKGHDGARMPSTSSYCLKREGQENSGPPWSVMFSPVFKDVVDTARDRWWGIDRRMAQVDSTHGRQQRGAGSS